MPKRFKQINNNENDIELTHEEINQLNDNELKKKIKNNLFDKFCVFCVNISLLILRTILFLFKLSSIYLLWICLHYFSAHLYAKFCVPNTIIGFIISPFIITTPHCQGLRWIVYNAANVINNMWIAIGAWMYSMIWIIGKEKSGVE